MDVCDIAMLSNIILLILLNIEPISICLSSKIIITGGHHITPFLGTNNGNGNDLNGLGNTLINGGSRPIAVPIPFPIGIPVPHFFPQPHPIFVPVERLVPFPVMAGGGGPLFGGTDLSPGYGIEGNFSIMIMKSNLTNQLNNYLPTQGNLQKLYHLLDARQAASNPVNTLIPLYNDNGLRLYPSVESTNYDTSTQLKSLFNHKPTINDRQLDQIISALQYTIAQRPQSYGDRLALGGSKSIDVYDKEIDDDDDQYHRIIEPRKSDDEDQTDTY